jgi:hypothetical protein
VACGLLATVFALWISYQWRGFKLDDAYIYCRYAENLAGGHGYVYNVGEKVNACTSFPMPYLLLLSYPLHIPLPSFLHWMSGFFLAAASVLTYALFVAEKRRASGLFAAFFLPVFTWLTWCLGMETFTLLTLVLGGILAGRLRKWTLAALLVGLAVVVRPPEGGLLALIIGASYWLRERRPPSVVQVAAFILPVLAWLVASWWQFGSPLPQTFIAKRLIARFPSDFSEIATGLNWGIATLAGGYFKEAVKLNPALWAAAPLALLGLWRILRVRGPSLVVAWGVAAFAFYLSLRISPFHWYLAPLWLAVIFLVAGGLDVLKWPALQVPLALVLVATQLSANLKGPATFGTNTRLQLYPAIGWYLRQHAPRTATIALSEIGMVGYYSGLRVLDLNGLVSPWLLRYRMQGRMSAWLLECRPDYFWLWTPGRDPGADAYASLTLRGLDEFNIGYELDGRFAMPDGTSIDLFRRVPERIYAARARDREARRLAAVGASRGQEFPRWQFADPADLGFWTCDQLALVARTQRPRGLLLESLGPDPKMEMALRDPIRFAAVKAIVVRMMVPPEKRWSRHFGQLFLSTSAPPQYSLESCIMFELIADGQYHTYALRVDRLQAASSGAALSGFRLDPRCSPGPVAVSSVQIARFDSDITSDSEFP